MKPILIITLMWCSLSSCGRNNNGEKIEKVSEVRLMAPRADFAPQEKDIALRVEDPGSADKSNADEDQTTGSSSGQGNTSVSDTSKKIVKEGEVSFETADIIAAHKRIADSLQKLGGYIAEDKQTNDNGENRKQDVLNIRIPAKNFDIFLNSISSSAVRIDQKNIRITDVTAHFIDISTQLKNKYLLETSYRDLLKKADKMSDILKVENKLTEIRTDIESTQSQLNYLSKQIAYSSLQLTFYTKAVVADQDYGFGYKFKNALGSGWQWLQDLFYGIISAWPMLILIGVIVWLIVRWRRRRRLKAA